MSKDQLRLINQLIREQKKMLNEDLAIPNEFEIPIGQMIEAKAKRAVVKKIIKKLENRRDNIQRGL